MGLLELLVAAILLPKVFIDFVRVFQNKRDGAIHPCQRADRRVCVENRLGGTAIPKLVYDHVEADSRSGDIIRAIPDFDILIGEHGVHGEACS